MSLSDIHPLVKKSAIWWLPFMLGLTLGRMMQMAGGMAKGMALLTLDEDYIRRFRTRPIGYRQRFIDGLQAAGVGVYEGAVGKGLTILTLGVANPANRLKERVYLSLPFRSCLRSL